MIDYKKQSAKSTRIKKFKNIGNGNISPIVNGQKLANGSAFYKTEEIDIDKSWTVMNYEEYVNYRSNEEKSLSQSLFGNSLYDFSWDLVAEIHNRRHSISEREGATKSSSISKKEAPGSPGFIFRFYKKFGFYWNVFPKTDYCYLPGSPDYKKEISPGIPKIPNLSRYPLSSFVNRSVGLRSRSVNRNETSAGVDITDSSLISSTKIETDSHSFFSKGGWENVEARQNVINNILRYEERNRTWTSLKSVTRSFLSMIKRTVIMTFTMVTELVSPTSNRRNLRIPLLLFFILLLPFLYFFIAGCAQEQVIESINNDSVLMRFISWSVGWFTSILLLVKDSLLFIPTICQQLTALLLSIFNSESSVQPEAITMRTHEKLPAHLPMVAANFSRELSKKELLAIQSGIIDRIKKELAGQENHMSARIDRLQEQMKLLTEDIKKMSGSFEGDWKNQFGKLEEEIKMELADIRKSVDTFGERAISGTIATPNEMIERVVAKYHADRTGKPDYALQSAGGYIVRVRCTQMYTKNTAKFYLFGLPLPWDVFNGPDTIIKPGVMPGECWAFEGSFAQVTLHLATRVKVTGFSIEHSPRELAPLGHISSAPKQFSVWALDSEEDENPVLLGRFTFLDNGESLQQFQALEYDKAVDLVELKVESNHGHPEYTCLYRFRVHGEPPPIEDMTTVNSTTINQNDQASIPH